MELLSYLLKVSACTVPFFAFYVLVLRKLSFFKINRFYLLATLLLSFIVPALQFTVEREVYQVSKFMSSPETPIYGFEQPQRVEVLEMPVMRQEVHWMSLLPLVYLIVVALLFIFSAWQMCRLLIYTRKYTRKEGDLKLVIKTTGFTNCSFFNYVFINETDLSGSDLAVLLKHEQVHSSQFHSVDKIILMVIKTVLWFNPIIYLFDKALEQAHEYEADEITSLKFGTNAYAKLLLKLAVTKSKMPLIHNFVKSPIKERIKMLFNAKSSSMKKLAYLLVLPVAIGLVWMFSVKVVYASPTIHFKEDVKNISPRTRQQSTKQNTEPSAERIKKAKQISNLADTNKAGEGLIPRIISASRITGDIKNSVSYFEDVVIEISGSSIKAKTAEWNRKNKELSVYNAVITNGGNMILAEKAVFNLSDGTYRTYQTASQNDEQISFSDFDLKEKENMITKAIQFKADSVRLSKDKTTITAMGKAEILFRDMRMVAEEITYNNNTKQGSAKNLVITQISSGTKIKGTNANFNLAGKVEIWQNTKGNLVVEP